jgi:acyl dehydratase
VFEPGSELPPYTLLAHNYASASTNRIHSDEEAARYGFRGGLVPGAAMYAYICRPLVAAYGRDFLARGALELKLIHPVYDGEPVAARATVVGTEPIRLRVELHNAGGLVCATGQATVAGETTLSDPARGEETPGPETATRYPRRPLPASERRPPASLATLAAGTVLGSLVVEEPWAELLDRLRSQYKDDLGLWRGEAAPLHPGALPDLATRILDRNVVLGPWIHTATTAWHRRAVEQGDLFLRGTVLEAKTKRGHDVVTLALGLFDGEESLLAEMRHEAIIRIGAREAP